MPSYQHYRKGNRVITSYGQGVVTKIRPEDGMCAVQLDKGGMLYTFPALYPLRKTMTAEELNASFEALEKMRKLNLEVECNELGIPCDHSQCRLCLLASADKGTKARRLSNSLIPFRTIN